MCDVCDCLLDVPDHLLLGTGVENVATLPKQDLQVFCNVSPGNIDPLDAVCDGKTFVHWDRMRDAITRVQDDTRGPSGGVE